LHSQRSILSMRGTCSRITRTNTAAITITTNHPRRSTSNLGNSSSDEELPELLPDSDRELVLNGVVGWHLEQIDWRVGPADIRQRVYGLAESRIAVLREHDDLQVRRPPLLINDIDRPLVTDFACGNRDRVARTLCLHAFNQLPAELFGLRRTRTYIERFVIDDCA